jgi:hypothetical protein
MALGFPAQGHRFQGDFHPAFFILRRLILIPIYLIFGHGFLRISRVMKPGVIPGSGF